jgi:hypothetical protein
MTMMLPARGRTECAGCGRLGGAEVDQDGRCGHCLTGLSVGGRPLYPVETSPGCWVSPLTGREVLRMPDGRWAPKP